MNTLTLSDLDVATASSGNSLLSMTMQLSMSFGVAIGAAFLALFGPAQGMGLDLARGAVLVPTFHHAYLSVGLLSLVAGLVFLQLEPRTTEPSGPKPQQVV